MEGERFHRNQGHQRWRIARSHDEPPSQPPLEPIEGPHLLQSGQWWDAWFANVDLPRSGEWQWWGGWWVWNRERWELWACYGSGKGWLRLSRHEDDDPDSGYAFLDGGPWLEVVVVASLSAFLGAFAASFSHGFAGSFGKELGQAAGSAAAQAARAGAGRLRDHLRALRDKPDRKRTTIEIQDEHQVLLVTGEEVDQLPDAAWTQLIDTDFPAGPGRLRWDPYAKRWRVLNVPKG